MLVFTHLVFSLNLILLPFDLLNLYLNGSQIYVKLLIRSFVLGLLLWLNITNYLLMLELNGLQRKNPLLLLVDAVQKVDCCLERQLTSIPLIQDLLLHQRVFFLKIDVIFVGDPIEERQLLNQLIQ